MSGGLSTAPGLNFNSSRTPSLVLSALAEHARRRPNQTAAAVIQRDGQAENVLTYSRMAEGTAALGSKLTSLVEQGQAVMLVSPSNPEYLMWLCACFAAGMRVFPMHPHSTVAEIRGAAERSGATAIITPETTIDVSELPVRRIPFEIASRELNTSGRGLVATQPGALLLQSSGTTGLPKLVLREHFALDAVAANVAAAMRLTSDDRVLAAVPLSHSYGVDLALAAIFAGACLEIVDPFDPVVMAACLTSRTTVFPGVPIMFDALSRMKPAHPPGRLRLVFSAGAPLPDRVFNSFFDVWGLKIGQLFGATELGSVTFNDPSSLSFNPAGVGLPMNGVSIRVLDLVNHKSVASPYQDGHIAIAAPSMLTHYLGDVTPLIDGHFLTGDLGHSDEHGNLFVTGRLKLLIDVGGLKVNPLEIEAVLSAHSKVAQCAVVPLKLSDTVTRLRAVVVPRTQTDAPSSEELRRFVKERVAPHKVPRVIECVASLPRSPSGKILRHVIVEQPC